MGKKKSSKKLDDKESKALNDENSLEPTEAVINKRVRPRCKIYHGCTDKNGNKASKILYPDQDYDLDGEILKVYQENPSYFTLKK